MKKIVTIFIICLLQLSAVYALPRGGRVGQYFAKFLDESEAESVISEMLFESFKLNVPQNIKISESLELTARIRELAGKNVRKGVNLRVFIAETPICDEVFFPGGIVLLTRGLMDMLDNAHLVDFILARNVAISSMNYPMKLIKREGLYPKLLNWIKVVKRNKQAVLPTAFLGSYLHSLSTIDQQKADSQGIKLTPDPEASKSAAIRLMSQYQSLVWPPSPPYPRSFLPRLQALRHLKLSTKH
ncbi:MAG: hypothetical protein GX221_10190 [Candidatus Riflebacteria bacterium]|nr:hypothetical protein [Candidatus Riflebacteria bacterium]